LREESLKTIARTVENKATKQLIVDPRVTQQERKETRKDTKRETASSVSTAINMQGTSQRIVRNPRKKKRQKKVCSLDVSPSTKTTSCQRFLKLKKKKKRLCSLE
jgi:type II secretory pathway component GspD/PulD (secretin)